MMVNDGLTHLCKELYPNPDNCELWQRIGNKATTRNLDNEILKNDFIKNKSQKIVEF